MNNNIYNGPQVPYIPQAVCKVKEKPEYTKLEVAFSVFSIIAAFAFVRYVIYYVMGFITTGVFIAIITAILIYLMKKGCKLTTFNKVNAGVLYIFSFVFSITANNFIKNLDAVFLFGAGAYLVYAVSSGNKDIEIVRAGYQYPR